jgi:nucleotide-binding universal stress UspA family protein
MYKHILVPTDGSPLSIKAAKAAVRLASEVGARVTAVYVVPPYAPSISSDGMGGFSEMHSLRNYQKTMRGVAEKAVAKTVAAAKSAGIKASSVVIDDRQPWQGIVAAAKREKCDLIAMASHGRRGLAGLLLGSETTKVLTHSKTPVLVWR